MIRIDKLLWYDYDKPCFYSFKAEGKEHEGGQKRKVREERGSRRNKKVSPVLGPALIWAMEGGVQVLGGIIFTVIFLSFYRKLAPSP